MRKILVTGGSGYIGSVVIRQLVERGYDIIVFDNFERGHRANIPSNVDVVAGDLRDLNMICSVMKKVKPDVVIHFAAYALVGESMAHPMMYFENNVTGGIHLLTAMDSVGCKRIIFSSSCATYGVPTKLPIDELMPQNPTNPYGYSKLVFEQICCWMQKTRGLRPTFLRYFNAAGAAFGMVEDHDPETHLIPNVLKVALGQKDYVPVFGTDYPTPDGTCVRDYIHVLDLSMAHILALEKETLGAFNLGTGRGISVREIIDACCSVTQRNIPIAIQPRRPGDPPALYASGEKARREMGWAPKYSDMATIIRDAWDAYRACSSGIRN